MDRNVGVDLSFFKGRINFTADYYNNRTDDVLEYLTVPLSTGRRNVKSNGGVVTNKGLELFLNIRWIQTSDITFSTSANVARNKNIIKRSLYTITVMRRRLAVPITEGELLMLPERKPVLFTDGNLPVSIRIAAIPCSN